ncbi:MAG: hypothetical protein CMN44_01095 [SAR116 cluster bacterium]|nr:hypothetical protein [SAR116 cluster bacterium]RPH11815.1 MAG: hypothetical protein CBC14_001085 [Alphaproteobacteria bacterium TMED54]
MFSPAKLIPLDRFKFLVKDTIIFGIAQAVSRSFALITFPVLSRNLSVAEYGTLDLFLTLSGFITILLIFGQDSAVARFFYETDKIKIRKEIISQSFQIQILLSLIVLPILLILSDYFKGIFKIEEFNIYLNIILMTIPCMVVINFSQNILKWTFSRNIFLFLTVGFSFFQAIFLLSALFFLELNVMTALLINLFNNIIFSIIGLFFIRKWIIFEFKNIYKNKLILFAAPIGLVCLIESFIPVIERQIILKYLNLYDLGIYAAATKIAMFIALLVGAFQICWDPMAIAIFKEKNASKTYNQVSRCFCILVCITVLLIDLVSEDIIILLSSERYQSSSYLIFPLCMALAIQSLGGITEIGINLSKKTHFYFVSYLFFITTFLISFSYLLPKFGILGVAYSVLISQVVKILISSFIAQKIYPISWNYRPLITLPFVTLIIGLFGNSNYLEADLKILIYVIFIFYLIFYLTFLLKTIFKKENE